MICEVTGFPKSEVGIWMLEEDPWEGFSRQTLEFSWIDSPSLEIENKWSSHDGMFWLEFQFQNLDRNQN